MARLVAEFETDGGLPSFEQGQKFRHYRIRLSTKDVAPEVLTIIYQLDSSYTSPVRMVTKGVPDFQEYITAYGDYEIQVAFRSITEPSKLQTLLSRRLSDALSECYGPSPSPDIQAALNDILSH